MKLVDFAIMAAIAYLIYLIASNQPPTTHP